MYKSKKILGVIPARGGSKGIPMKNIIKLGDKPLIQYTIDQCKSSTLLTKFVVSTDSEQIENISVDLGAEVLKRPPEISTDTSRTEECLIHCLSLMELKGEFFDYVAILEPTSPFRKYETIDESIKYLIDENKNSLLTCKSSTENIGELKNGNIFKPLITDNPRRRQERIPLFIESSTIYIVKSNYLIKTKSIVSKEWLVKIIDPLEAIDINTELDLNYAKFLLSVKNQ